MIHQTLVSSVPFFSELRLDIGPAQQSQWETFPLPVVAAKAQGRLSGGQTGSCSEWFWLARFETCSPGAAGVGTTLPEPQDERRER